MDKGRTKVKVTDEKRQKEVMSDRKEKNPRLNEGVTGGLRRRDARQEGEESSSEVFKKGWGVGQE